MSVLPLTVWYCCSFGIAFRHAGKCLLNRFTKVKNKIQMQNLNSSARTAAKTKFKSWGLIPSAKIATILMLAVVLFKGIKLINQI
jgi:hypothetical protein